jgi:hypothetical protein
VLSGVIALPKAVLSGVIALPKAALSGVIALPNSSFAPCALDFVQRRRVFQGGGVAEVRGADDAAHHVGISRFWYVADENDFARGERFARLDGERVF